MLAMAAQETPLCTDVKGCLEAQEQDVQAFGPRRIQVQPKAEPKAEPAAASVLRKAAEAVAFLLEA